MSPCAPRTAGAAGGVRMCHGSPMQGLAPLPIDIPPLPGLPSSRGSRRGEYSTRAHRARNSHMHGAHLPRKLKSPGGTA